MISKNKALTNVISEMKSKKHDYSAEDARDTLDRIIGFTTNCDTKASIVLGIFGVLLSIIINDALLENFKHFIDESLTKGLVSIIYFLILICSILIFIRGIILIILSLKATVQTSGKDSKIYFTDISLNELEKYKEDVFKQTEYDILEDLINQIHINSIICTIKYKKYNIGLFSSFFGFGLFIALYIIGTIIFI